jgi:hypothetical protein
VYLKFSSLSEISDSGVPVLSKGHTPVLRETMPNTKPEEVKNKTDQNKILIGVKNKMQGGQKVTVHKAMCRHNQSQLILITDILLCYMSGGSICAS